MSTKKSRSDVAMKKNTKIDLVRHNNESVLRSCISPHLKRSCLNSDLGLGGWQRKILKTVLLSLQSYLLKTTVDVLITMCRKKKQKKTRDTSEL